ncbi:hypothetical protein [Paucilactobacillus nenjiangensis]|uniref:Uncharacterized protein n=1 Tax=Paucilactobacillus nenjiangensis TaxID=1296540 RepID=A0A5P1X091_9LACO|nr:hypothetical protein [Paucilactobacillus nenjiangensis]QER67302.1 hypothetical protein F0161_05165 [Paucilactobacillus nenjiangensis]
MSQNNHYDLTDGTNSKKRLYKKGAVNKTDVLFTAFFECARHGRQLGGESPLWAVVVGTTSQGQGCPL